MTRKEQLIALRGRDLIELCQKLGVKVHASKNSLKESKLGVVERILKAEAVESEQECTSIPFDGMDEFVGRLVTIAKGSDPGILDGLCDIIRSIPDVYPNTVVEGEGRSYTITAGNNKKSVVVPFMFGLAVIYGDDDCEYVEIKGVKDWINQFCAG